MINQNVIGNKNILNMKNIDVSLGVKGKVGLDWDNISLDTALKRVDIIGKEVGVQFLLFKTKNGFHVYLFFNKKISPAENFSIREKYWDCPLRLQYSKARFETTGKDYDILFTMKKDYFEKLIRR